MICPNHLVNANAGVSSSIVSVKYDSSVSHMEVEVKSSNQRQVLASFNDCTRTFSNEFLSLQHPYLSALSTRLFNPIPGHVLAQWLLASFSQVSEKLTKGSEPTKFCGLSSLSTIN